MNRILFVGDASEAGPLRDSLQGYADRWHMSFASTATEVVEVLAGHPFDVVVADLQAADTDGIALLGQVKAQHPCAARIGLSQPAGSDAVMRALPVAHQLVGKPVDSQQLWRVVERTCCLNGLMDNGAIRGLLGGLDRLPSVPRSYVALTQAMARDDVSTAQIAAIVEKDAAMSSKVLQLINSAFFGRARRISSISVTVSYLGLDCLKALALGAHVFGMLGDAESRAYGLEALQERSLATAQLARRFLSTSGRAEEGFTAGLLQNIGRLVLAVCLKERYQEVVERARRGGAPIAEVERETLRVSHAEVGAYLLNLWGLPATIVEAVAFHHAPGGVLHDDTDLVDAVHVADALVDQAMDRADGAADELALDPIVVARDGTGETLRQWRAIAAEELTGMRRP